MQLYIEKLICNKLKASEVKKEATIQSLWSGYGKIIRLLVKGVPTLQSVILKHIVLPTQQVHPRGWNTDLSHQRKLKSYQVEMYWYKKYAALCGKNCRIAKCYYLDTIKDEQIILLEDLDASGYPVRKSDLMIAEVKTCLKWLANFHATFLNVEPEGLWDIGTYWNLSTRKEEFTSMKDGLLKDAAFELDEILNNCKFKTFVHGDAKVANFCFSEDGKSVAAVDFQYVGGGCGIKDVVYLLGSCLDEEACELFEKDLLDCYFNELKKACKSQYKTINFEALEKEWRYLFPIAWTDFNRFLCGWMPTHQKLNSYSKKIENNTLKTLNN